MPVDAFGGVEVEEPSRDEFGGVAVEEVPASTVAPPPSRLDRTLRFLRPGIISPSGLAIGANLQPAQVQRLERAIVGPVQRGIEAGGEIAHEALAPAASEFLRRTGIDPSSTQERVINLPRSRGRGVVAGLENLAAGTAESLMQPENAALLVATAGEGNLARAASLTFATQQFTQLPDQIQNAVRVVSDPKATTAQKVEAIGQPGVSTLLTATMAKHGLRPERIAGRAEIEAPPRPLPSTEPPTPGAETPLPPRVPQPPPPSPPALARPEAAAIPSSIEQLHKGTPPITAGNIRIRIQMPDGSIIPALWNGYYEAPGTKFDGMPSLATLVQGKWSHGFRLPQGAKLLDEVPTFEDWKAGKKPVPAAAPVGEPMVTLYHGEGAPGGGGVDTRFFTKDPKRAASYGPNVTEVQVPKYVADTAEAERQKQGTGTSGDAILPDEWVKKAKPMAQPPPQPVVEIGDQPSTVPTAIPAKLTAAAYIPEGATVSETGPNHPAILSRLGVLGFETAESRNTPQFGFVDESGKFLTREQAAERAKATGQDLKEFEPGEPAYSDDIASPTQPGVPLSEAKPTVPAASAAAPEIAAVQAESEVAKVANTEGKRAAKDIKQELIDALQEKLMKAPAVAKPGDTVTVDIPGDGIFTIPNDIEAISTVLERARKLKTDPGKAPGVPKKAVKQSGRAIQRTAGLSAEIEAAKAAGPTVPTEPAPVGMGAAVSSEFDLNPNTPTGIKNATVDLERQRRGLRPAIQPLRRAFGQVWDRAMAMIDHDPGVVDTLIDSLRETPRALTDIEDAILLHRQVDLQNEYGKATRDLAQAFEDGRVDAVASEKLRVARLSDQLFDLYNIGKKVGTETGRGLAARRMMVNEDFSLAQMELEKRTAKGGRPLTDDERAEVAALHTRIADTERAYKEYRDATEKRMVEVETARSIAELRASTVPTFDKRILSHAETIVKRMETAAKPAADRLRERLARMSVGVDPTIISDAAIVGSAKIARLGLDLAKFTDEMVRDFGEKLRPMINDIWAEANRIIDAVTSKVPDPVRQAIKKATTLTEIKESITKDIAAKFAKGDKDKISWQVQKLARELVKSGVTDREQLIDQIHSLLQDAIPGITRREAMDAISGYGQFKQLTKDQISVTLRGMKGEMQQLAKLEDMAAGQPPLKTGLERRTPTDAERRLIKEVNDAKLKFQIPVDNPETQLRSALDTLKAGLQTRIADYEDRIARGDFAKRPRRNVELDPEAQRLKAQAEKAKEEFQRGVQLDRLKNMGRVERTSDWVVKWRRGFLLSGPVTLAKLTSAAIQRFAITPAEELIGGGISKAIPKVASKAAREGGLNVQAEARAITQGMTQGMRDAWQVLRTGQSDLDVLYGKAALVPPSVIDFFGHVHGALKAPVKRAEFARSFEKRSRTAIAAGVDVSDPIVQSNLVIEAYKDANRSIFLQDNRVVTAYRRALSALEQVNKETGRTPLAGKAAATIARVLLPIVKVPTNIVAETMQYATGSVTGSARLARAFARGIETLKPEEADLIMRSLKKGSLGAAVMLVGYLNPEVIGGYYQPGEKRKPGEPKAGTIRLYGYNIPSYLIHNPILETLQIGATVRRVAESKISKKDPETQGLASGIMAAGLGLLEEVPFVRETMETAKAFNPRERGAFFGELTKSLAVPQLLQSLATYQDKDRFGRPIHRQPRTTLQHVEMGVPGLRQNVPLKKQTATP